jgi:hypothetical protein
MIQAEYIKLLQTLRDQEYALSDAAAACGDRVMSDRHHHKAQGLTMAIGAINQYDYDVWFCGWLEQELSK